MKTILYIIFSLVLFSTCQQKSREVQKETTVSFESVKITNPVLPGDRPDPTVIQIGEFYYASATSNEWAPLFPIFKSADLIEWELINYVFPDGAPGWAKNNFWAPELAYDPDQQKVYMYYTARDKNSNRLSVAVASSDSPSGNFKDHGPLVAQELGSIDAFEFKDEEGKIFVLWKEDGNSKGQPTPMWAQEINKERTHLIGAPTELFRNDEPWEKNLVEGVCVFKENGYFYATYSAGACCDKQCNYQTGVARSNSLLGPWKKYEGNPILVDNAKWKCAGHGTVVKKDGDHYMLYHAYSTQGSVFVGREGIIEKISWTEDDWPVFKNAANYDREKASLDFTNDFQNGLSPLWQWRVTQNIQFTTGKEGLLLQASEENENLGTLLVQSTRFTDYTMETIIDHSPSSASGGIILIGAANNGFGAPIAGIGMALNDSGIQIFENRDKEIKIFHEEKLKVEGKITLLMEVRDGHLIHFSYQSEGIERKEIPLEIDAGHLVPWGMGFRLGMFAKGNPNEEVNFVNTSISYR